MARVRRVIAPSMRVSSRFSVSGRMSTNTGRAPRSTTAFTVDTKVKGGTMTSSPGRRSSRSAAISSACVHEVVSSAFGDPVSRSSHSWQARVYGPSPWSGPSAMTRVTYSASRPVTAARLNGMGCT